MSKTIEQYEIGQRFEYNNDVYELVCVGNLYHFDNLNNTRVMGRHEAEVNGWLESGELKPINN